MKEKNNELSELAKKLGSIGGKKRAQNLSKERLSEIGREAVRKRWEKRRKEQSENP